MNNNNNVCELYKHEMLTHSHSFKNWSTGTRRLQVKWPMDFKFYNKTCITILNFLELFAEVNVHK